MTKLGIQKSNSRCLIKELLAQFELSKIQTEYYVSPVGFIVRIPHTNNSRLNFILKLITLSPL